MNEQKAKPQPEAPAPAASAPEKLLDENRLQMLKDIVADLFPNKNYIIYVFGENEPTWGGIISNCNSESIVFALKQAVIKIESGTAIVPGQNN